MNKILTSPWSITIGGTMIGVLAAFFLNDWNENRSLKNYRNQIFDKITEEIKSNHKIIERNQEQLKVIYEAYSLLEFKGVSVRMKPEKMDSIRNMYPTFLTVIDSLPFKDSLYDYTVKIDVDIPTINQLSNFAWTASKTSEVYSQVDFECLYWFESTYTLQDKLNGEFIEVFQVITGSVPVNNFQKYIIKKTKLILIYEEILINRYKQVDDKTSICRT